MAIDWISAYGKRQFDPGMMANTYNLSTRKAEVMDLCEFNAIVHARDAW